MEVKVAVPVDHHHLNLDKSACSTPYLTAPSTPTRFGNLFFSAPTSPNSSFSSSSSSFFNEDFEFNFPGHNLDRASLPPADELFYGGKIKPLLKPPTRLHVTGNNNYDTPASTSSSSPRSPISSIVLCQGKRMAQEVFSPRQLHRKVDSDPFTVAVDKETRRDSYYAEEGFERMSRLPSRHVNACIRKGTRSLSPLGIPDVMFDDVTSSHPPKTSHANSKNFSKSWINSGTSSSVASAYNAIMSAISFSKVSKMWKLRDLLLFRSASEGRATTGKDPLRKYSLLSTKESMSEDVKNSSFRSTESVGSVSSRRRGGGSVSPHERHYTVNRAATEEMRRKTVLPYKHGLLGCLGFNNHGLHDISRGAFGSMARNAS